MLPTDSGLRQLCIRSASANEMKAYAVSQGHTTLRQSGWQRVLAGQTSIEEVLRVCANDEDQREVETIDQSAPVLSGYVR